MLTTLAKNRQASAYAGESVPALTLFGALFITAPTSANGGTPGTEVSSANPSLYVRKPLTFGAPSAAGVRTATATFDVPAGSSLAGQGIFDAVTAGNFVDGAVFTTIVGGNPTATPQVYNFAGQAVVTFTITAI